MFYSYLELNLFLVRLALLNSHHVKVLTMWVLRRQDSNLRPSGYEPGELPTAPLHDVFGSAYETWTRDLLRDRQAF